MERLTIRVPEQQITEVEELVDAGQFPNRSEAIRSAVRDMLNDHNNHDEQSHRTPNDRNWVNA